MSYFINKSAVPAPWYTKEELAKAGGIEGAFRAGLDFRFCDVNCQYFSIRDLVPLWQDGVLAIYLYEHPMDREKQVSINIKKELGL